MPSSRSPGAPAGSDRSDESVFTMSRVSNGFGSHSIAAPSASCTNIGVATPVCGRRIVLKRYS
jgi:hypothetical protein